MAEPEKLGGRRLLLRPLKASDAAALVDAVELSRGVLARRAGLPAGDFDGPGFVARCAGESRRGASVSWGIFERRTGALAGLAKLEGLPEGALLGGWVRTDLQGRGYATEAARAALEGAFGALGLHRVRARIEPSNRAARKVLRRAGFRYEGRLRAEAKLNGRWVDQECWGVLRDEWSR